VGEGDIIGSDVAPPVGVLVGEGEDIIGSDVAPPVGVLVGEGEVNPVGSVAGEEVEPPGTEIPPPPGSRPPGVWAITEMGNAAPKMQHKVRTNFWGSMIRSLHYKLS
jgi:hypothetical protein